MKTGKGLVPGLGSRAQSFGAVVRRGRGGNVVAVSTLLGHASVATTSRYLDHLQLAELRAVVPALPVPAAP